MVRFFQAEILRFFPSFPFGLGICCMKVPCFGLPTLLSQIDVNHHFHAFLGRTLHVSCVCVRVCVCDCVVFFVKGDFLKIRTQFAVEMLLCIIYIFFSSIQTSPKEMLWVEVASINNSYFLVHLLHAEV